MFIMALKSIWPHERNHWLIIIIVVNSSQPGISSKDSFLFFSCFLTSYSFNPRIALISVSETLDSAHSFKFVNILLASLCFCQTTELWSNMSLCSYLHPGMSPFSPSATLLLDIFYIPDKHNHPLSKDSAFKFTNLLLNSYSHHKWP